MNEELPPYACSDGREEILIIVKRLFDEGWMEDLEGIYIEVMKSLGGKCNPNLVRDEISAEHERRYFMLS